MSQKLSRLNATTSRWSLRQLARGVLVRCMPQRFLLESLPGTGAVYLTFDDGPHPEHTPRLLDVLADRGARATFFLIGRECERHPDVVQRIVAEGHTVGNHTYSHVNARCVPPSRFLDEILQTNEILESLVGTRSSFVRPPYGALRLPTLLRLWQADQTVVLWNVDSKDYLWSSQSKGRAWFAVHPLRHGDIVLMHDNREHTPAVVADLLCSCRTFDIHVDRLNRSAQRSRSWQCK